ncbi:DUF5999 family protein [Kitasatospora sp. NPDC056783]|uniref:DUF5999 family protein n=1 Tax=Kitasatospora sp. NPDC056783 TaxID=3345943 RepID=UPI003698931A
MPHLDPTGSPADRASTAPTFVFALLAGGGRGEAAAQAGADSVTVYADGSRVSLHPPGHDGPESLVAAALPQGATATGTLSVDGVLLPAPVRADGTWTARAAQYRGWAVVTLTPAGGHEIPRVTLTTDSGTPVAGPNRDASCEHRPACPVAEAADFQAAVAVNGHPEQGWSLLCNGVVLFSDTGAAMPDGRVVAPQDRRTGICERAA